MMAWPPLSSASTRSSFSVSVNPAISSGSDHSDVRRRRSRDGAVRILSIHCAAMFAMRAVSARRQRRRQQSPARGREAWARRSPPRRSDALRVSAMSSRSLQRRVRADVAPECRHRRVDQLSALPGVQALRRLRPGSTRIRWRAVARNGQSLCAATTLRAAAYFAGRQCGSALVGDRLAIAAPPRSPPRYPGAHGLRRASAPGYRSTPTARDGSPSIVVGVAQDDAVARPAPASS